MLISLALGHDSWTVLAVIPPTHMEILSVINERWGLSRWTKRKEHKCSFLCWLRFFKALPIELHHHSDRMNQGPIFWPTFRRNDKYNAGGRQIRWLLCPNGWSYNCECDTQHWLRKQNLNDLIFLHQILPWAHRSGNIVCTKLFTVCWLSLSFFYKGRLQEDT